MFKIYFKHDHNDAFKKKKRNCQNINDITIEIK